MSISTAGPIFPEEQRLRVRQPVPRVILTRAGERLMQAELDQLRQRLAGEFTERLREARDSGGSHENDEYLQIKEEEAVVASRIRQLEGLLQSAEVVDDEASSRDGTVTLGALVEVKDTDSGAVRRHRITGSFEPVESGDVSANSPVGEALMGRVPGDTVEVELPNGRTARLEVMSVQRPAPAMAGPS